MNESAGLIARYKKRPCLSSMKSSIKKAARNLNRKLNRDDLVMLRNLLLILLTAALSGCASDYEYPLEMLRAYCVPNEYKIRIQTIESKRDDRPIRISRIFLPEQHQPAFLGLCQPFRSPSLKNYDGLKFSFRSLNYPQRFKLELLLWEPSPEPELFEVRAPWLVESDQWIDVTVPFSKFVMARSELPYPPATFPYWNVSSCDFQFYRLGNENPETVFEITSLILFKNPR
jgi:hypothetical protein